MEMKVHTCDVQHADSDGSIYVQADGGDWIEIDNPNHDDRVRNRGDTYQVPLAQTSFKIKATSSDGWCVDSIGYGPVTVALCAERVWLDTPCEGGSDPCFEQISFDPTTGLSSLCQPPPPSSSPMDDANSPDSRLIPSPFPTERSGTGIS